MLWHKVQGAGGVGGLESWDFTTSNTAIADTPYTTIFAVDALDGPSDLTPAYDLFRFENSGAKMYVCDRTLDRIYQYSLSTSYDAISFSYDSLFRYVGGNTGLDNGFFMASDGSKLWVTDNATEEVDYYTLSTNFDISTATYSTTSTVVAAQDTVGRSCAVSSDGNTLWVSGGNDNQIMEFGFSTSFDMSTLSFTQESAWGGTDDFFITNSDGTKSWSWGFNSDRINHDTYSTGWDVSTRSTGTGATLSDMGISVTIADEVFGFQWNSDGTAAWIAAQSTTGPIFMFKLTYSTTAYDVSDLTWTAPASWTDISTNDWHIKFNNNGSKMFVLRDTGSQAVVREVPLSTAYDVTSAGTPVDSSDLTQTSSPKSFCFNAAGTKMFIAHISRHIYEYDLSTAFDVSTISYSGNSLDAGLLNEVLCFQMNSAGTEIYYNDGADGIGVIDLTTANTFSGGYTINSVYNGFVHSGQMFSPQFSPDGLRFVAWEVSGVNNTLNSWILSTPFDASTEGSKTSKSFSDHTGGVLGGDEITKAQINRNGTKGILRLDNAGFYTNFTLSE